jgi:hypothetical protein
MLMGQFGIDRVPLMEFTFRDCRRLATSLDLGSEKVNEREQCAIAISYDRKPLELIPGTWLEAEEELNLERHETNDKARGKSLLSRNL